jgi:hypothetical protein
MVTSPAGGDPKPVVVALLRASERHADDHRPPAHAAQLFEDIAGVRGVRPSAVSRYRAEDAECPWRQLRWPSQCVRRPRSTNHPFTANTYNAVAIPIATPNATWPSVTGHGFPRRSCRAGRRRPTDQPEKAVWRAARNAFISKD